MSSYSFIVRKATPEDASDVRDILQEAFNKYMKDTGLTGSMEALEESCEEIEEKIRTSKVFIALVNNVPVGTIRFEIKNDTAHISRFGVRLGYQNIGIGKSLLNLVDSEIKANALKKAYLYAASKYTDLIRFYYGRGFYIESTTTDRGYVRAKLVKEY